MRIYLARTGSLRPLQWAGVSRYSVCMIQAIRRQAPETEFIGFHHSLRGRLPPEAESLEQSMGIRVLPVRWPDFSGIGGYNEWLDRWIVPRLLERAGCEIAWGANCSVPCSRRRRFRSVVTIHDLFLLASPALGPPEFFRHTLRWVHAVSRHCDLVLTDSEFSREQVVRLLGVSPERIVVTPLAPAPSVLSAAPDDSVRLLARLQVPAAPVLSVGTVESRKNYVRGMQAFAEARARIGMDLHWVVAGGRGWQAELVYRERARLGLDQCVHLCHDLTDPDLAALYRGSRCLFFPSPHEGFGLPALEAMANGLPVVAARAGALPEVVADAAELADPQSPLEMAQQLVRVLTDESRRRYLVDRGHRRAAEFTWSASASRMLRALRELVQDGPSSSEAQPRPPDPG